MAISTKNIGAYVPPKTDSKRDVVLGLMKHHRGLFEKEGVHNPKFIPRLCYKHNGIKIIGFYPKELYGGIDIYVEFCDRDYNPEDSSRTLWKWSYNPEFATDYLLSEPHAATRDQRYLIPISELINVTELHSTQNKAPVIVEPVMQTKPSQVINHHDMLDDSPDQPGEFIIAENAGAGTDVPYDAMTLRDFAAIQWKKPVSHKKWLNELITKFF